MVEVYHQLKVFIFYLIYLGAKVDDKIPSVYNKSVESNHPQMPGQMNQSFGLRSKSVSKLIPEAILGSKIDNPSRQFDSNIPLVQQKEDSKQVYF